MKKLAVVLFTLSSFIAHAQEKDEIIPWRKVKDTIHLPTPFEFRYVDSNGFSKNEIYTKCFNYLASHLEGNNTTLSMNHFKIQDSASGKIFMQGIKADAYVTARYDLTIDIKDGKFRCIFSHYQWNVGTGLLAGWYDVTPDMRKYEYLLTQEPPKLFAALCDYVRKNDDKNF